VALKRRRYPRGPYVTPVEILRTDEHALHSRSEEISAGGMVVRTDETCFDGEVVRLRFALPGGGQIVTLAAIVRWVKTSRESFAVGLEFRGAPAEVRDAIGHYVTTVTGLP
jgi:uncharacterized protein (TIGR02266 family)